MFALVVRFNIRDEESAKKFDALTAEVVESIIDHRVEFLSPGPAKGLQGN